ncbi:MAG: TetR family transcriptional regulator [Candidatus Latescibacteria bacterium]|nr:TetR family transcriptional regulator [Candidatus Latescibacterota bacterium]NIM22682.1 TetR family transcriptional regulator [Candidatus Latescibacterota bacterium]NIM64971.1 TetR family transcriptional regulator [Candidatus Latescibacterota bacterium]NIO01486.1 TetR family transcriptional regulator [Candidatus Latescibacterota bacterium]NIO27996.1 TetR family transcriptional regulator [Candidatus Latescibacterota bacterium]
MPIAPPKDRGRGTIDNIFNAAVRHFSMKGYEGARIDEIAGEAGINKASIYYHVGDKAELYQMVIDRILGTIADRVAENIKKSPVNEDRIRIFVKTIARNIGANEHFAPLMMREIASGGAHLSDSVMLQMMRVFGALFCILDEGKNEGKLRPVNPLVVHLMIIGGLVFYMAGGSLRQRIGSLGEAELQIDLDIPMDKAAEQFADLIAAALRV